MQKYVIIYVKNSSKSFFIIEKMKKTESAQLCTPYMMLAGSRTRSVYVSENFNNASKKVDTINPL